METWSQPTAIPGPEQKRSLEEEKQKNFEKLMNFIKN